MSIGPIQVIAFGFERTDQFRGEVLEELANLRGRGLIRLIDLFVAIKDESGDLAVVEMNDLTETETVEFGQIIGKLLGLDGVKTEELAAGAIEATLTAASHSVGLDYKGIKQVVENLPAGEAFGVLMFEHTWAIPLRDAIRRAGGVPLAQGFLTLEALTMVGAELRAITEAEQAIEVAEIVKSVSILDTLVTLQEAEAIKTAIAADVVRTLAIAEVIEEVAVQEAIETLAVAGLLEEQYLQPAIEAEAAQAAADKEIFAELDQ
jgi:uncharacterized membrane protein